VAVAATVVAAAEADPDLLLRPWTEEDAPALQRAVAESIEHLRPWMAWARDGPLDVDARRALIRAAAARGERAYGLWSGDRVVGAGGLHARIGPGGLEIGYWVHARETGRGLATELTRRLIEVAFAVPGIGYVEIHHDLANVASGRIPVRLGFVHVEDRPRTDPLAPADGGTDRVWRLPRARAPSG